MSKSPPDKPEMEPRVDARSWADVAVTFIRRDPVWSLRLHEWMNQRLEMRYEDGPERSCITLVTDEQVGGITSDCVPLLVSLSLY